MTYNPKLVDFIASSGLPRSKCVEVCDMADHIAEQCIETILRNVKVVDPILLPATIMLACRMIDISIKDISQHCMDLAEKNLKEWI